MTTKEEHESPDKLLRLIVTLDSDNDLTIGFDGFGWHTHGDLLASISGLPETDAVRQFIDGILNGEHVIAVSRVEGIVRDVWPTDDPLGEFTYKPAEETIEFRRWSGEVIPIVAPR